MSLSLFNSTQRAIDGFLNRKASSALNSIKSPLIRGVAGDFLNSLVPGLGGGIPDFRESAYADVVNERLAASDRQFANVIAVYRDSTSSENALAGNSYDWRARIRPKNGGASQFYQDAMGVPDSLLRPIKESNGLIWPYTPSTSIGGTVEYNETLLHGMNYPINTFIASRPSDISLTADFTANDIYEARYFLAMMVFFRVATKAYFGDAAVRDGKFGAPPPVMLFEYLGDHGFNKVPVVIKSYQITLADDVDYVPVVVNSASPGPQITYVPTRASVTCTLAPTFTPNKLRKRFDLKSVTTGQAYKDGFI